MSRNLNRVSTKSCKPFRQIVKLKNPTDASVSHGVTLERDLETNVAHVQWYKHCPNQGGHQIMLELGNHGLVPEELLQPHPIFGGIKIGELVVKAKNSKYWSVNEPAFSIHIKHIAFRFGIVTGIDLRTGKVRSMQKIICTIIEILR